MNTRKIINENFIKPFCAKDRKNIGIELEFPLLNLKKAPVEHSVALGLLEYMIKNHSFRVAETDSRGKLAFIINKDGDVLSFDNSYNNFEFSMEKCENLLDCAKRFYKLYDIVQNFLLPRSHTLCGTGTNPFKEHIKSDFVSFPVYEMIHEFLGNFCGGAYHTYTDFPAYLSSVQTHLDVKEDELAKSLTLFANLDFVRALLFSNSPAFLGADGFSDCVCFRDYLWEMSGFGSLGKNTGKICSDFSSISDIEDLILERKMFNRIRNGKYETITPVTISEYFNNDDSDENDIGCYLSFCNVEVTRRGTLEVRSDCAQPVSEAFCASAFNLGILYAKEKATQLLDEFLNNNIPKEILESPEKNKILRDNVIYEYKLPASESEVQKLLMALVALAEESLIKRGLGEEKLLNPLFARAEHITCPALIWKQLLKDGISIETIIKKFSSADEMVSHLAF
ncbi:MAG: hypothetical protein II978_07815 [Clostridia bacterium]|nr:hypothetical protein [Clostridia bacterium]